MRQQPKWNHYHCPKCGGITIARHDDEGVTPFLIRCRARDTISSLGHRAKGCDENARSNLFTGPQGDEQIPHVIFYRPSPMDAIAAINGEPKRDRTWWLEHYKNGGSLMRENITTMT